MIKERNIAVSILLSIVTCGIYALYWFVVLTDEVAAASGETSLPSGAVSCLLNIVTCGIYGYFWSYKMGQNVAVAQQKNELPVKDNAVLYIVLALFGLQIVNYALIQTDLNAIAKKGM